MENFKRKKPNLSLTKSPNLAKSPKIRIEDKHVVVDVSLLSDDDDDFVTPPPKLRSPNLSQQSNDSDKTVIYSVSPQTPKKTPQKTPSISSTAKISSGSKDRFFSPSKKRSVKKRTPTKIRRNLAKELTGNAGHTEDLEDVPGFDKACQGLDDKTIFFLQIVDRYLNDNSLKPLLDESAQELLRSYMLVVHPGMKLVCRLFWRKEGWYRRKQISEIVSEDKEPLDDPSLDEMVESLVRSNWLKLGCNNMTFEELAVILKAEEVKLICKDLKLKVHSKQDAIEALSSFSRRTSNISSFFTPGKASDNSHRVLKIMRAKAGSCYKLSDFARSTLNKLYVLMYLGMDYTMIREKKLELALIHDKINRESYPVDRDMKLDNASAVFENKDEFERYMVAHTINEEFLSETSSVAKSDLVKRVFIAFKAIASEEMSRYKALPTWLRRFTPAYLYIRILDSGVQELKKEKTAENYELALDILTRLIFQTAFRQHKKAGWYAEKALILHSLLHRCDEAAEVLLEGFKSNLSEEEKDLMRRRAVKIARQKTNKISEHLKTQLLEHANKDNILEKNLDADHVYKQPMENTSKGKSRFETKTSEGRIIQCVEEFAITHYISTGKFTHGEHWEGRIITTIFFLLFWDIIYSKPRGVRGIFLSHFQVYPLDLFSESFYVNRQTIIDDRLSLIEESSEMEVLKMMEDVWNKRPEHELSGINRSISWCALRGVAGCAGARALAALCRRLARDYRYAHSGFPDVTLWNVHNKEIKFVEVKSDNDHSSMKQIQWMNYLREHGIDTGFCYVGTDTTRQRCRSNKASS
ncbi:fanconi-associated nuclease 1-like isoform X2 [Choristoneura fumiferana]